MKRARVFWFLILHCGWLISFSGFGQTTPSEPRKLPDAKLTIRVADDLGMNIPGAGVRLGFQNPTNGQMQIVSGDTDLDGKFTGQGATVAVVGCDVRKAGYYLAGASIAAFTNRIGDRWQPWDATYTSVLRKIEKPIPVFARIANVRVPAQGRPCGFDLKEADWVAPWGKGIVADFVFTAESHYTNRNGYTASMKLTFSNPLDGIQPANLPPEYANSDFIWHRTAPETGYLSEYEQNKVTPKMHYLIPTVPGVHRNEDIEKQKFYFRVRTIEKDGKLVSAFYGKLSAGLEMLIPNQQEVRIVLNYFLNPTPLDRNMEFDLKQNLFKNLKFDEQPRKP